MEIFLQLLMCESWMKLHLLLYAINLKSSYLRKVFPIRYQFTLTLQKPEGFRVKASEGEVVVFYFETSATQNLKSSGFPEGETAWQNRPHPSNSPMEVSRNLSFCYDIGIKCGPSSNLYHVVYATKGLTVP